MTVRGVQAGTLLFELAFSLWIVLGVILETKSSPGLSEDELELTAWLYFAMWLVVGVSSVVALAGVVLAESLRNSGVPSGREWVAILAGTLFGAGWAIVIAVGVVIARVVGDTEIVALLLFWSYLILGPLLAFGCSAKLIGRKSPGAQVLAA